MSLKKLPEIQAKHSKNISFDPKEDVLTHWQPDKRAAHPPQADVLELYGVVGDDWSDTPITAVAVAEFLRNKGDIIVSINSAGGSYFEGIAIYNLLRAHPHKITVHIIGDAASAASVIAMAGDEILIGEGAFMMIHNCWAMCVGNRHDLAQSIELMQQIDGAMADLYVQQTGKSTEAIIAMMDAETWLNAETAIAEGFATGQLHAPTDEQPNPQNQRRKAKAQIEQALRAQGMSRSQTRQVLNHFKADPMPCAGNGDPVKLRADLSILLNELKTLTQETTQ